MPSCSICNTQNPEENHTCLTCGFNLSPYPLSFSIPQDYIRLEQIKLQWGRELWRQLQEKCSLFEQEKSKLLENNTELQQKLDSINAENTEIKEKNTRLEKQIKQLEMRNDELKKEVVSIELDSTKSIPDQKEKTDTPNILKQVEIRIDKNIGVLDKFARLEELLSTQRFKESDSETNQIILTIAEREREGYLKRIHAENFPVPELRKINEMWLKYSRDKFGISVQQQIYASLGGTKEFNQLVWESFGITVGWFSGSNWLEYDELDFSLSAPEGHLPRSIWLRGAIFWMDNITTEI